MTTRQNKLILISVAAFVGGAVGLAHAGAVNSASVCVFDVTGINKGVALELAVAAKSHKSEYAVHEDFVEKADSDLQSSFSRFVESEVLSGTHCDGLVISGFFTESHVYGGDQTKGVLKLEDVSKLLAQPKFKNWASRVNAVYLDGSLTKTAEATLKSTFPRAEFVGNDGQDGKKGAVRKLNAEKFLQYTYPTDDSPYAAVGMHDLLKRMTDGINADYKKTETQQFNKMPPRQDDPSTQLGSPTQTHPSAGVIQEGNHILPPNSTLGPDYGK